MAVPTLFVWSTADPAISREAADGCAQYVTGPFRYEVLEGVDHWVPELEADRLNELLLAHPRVGTKEWPRKATSIVQEENWAVVGIGWAVGRHWMGKMAPCLRARSHTSMAVRGEPQAQRKNRALDPD